VNLRNPVQGKHLRYSREGRLLEGGPEGSWVFFAQVKVEKVKVKVGLIQLEGVRMRVADTGSKDRPAGFRRDGKVQIEIETDSNEVDFTQAQRLLASVFLTKDDLPNGAQFERLAAYFGSKYSNSDPEAIQQFIKETSDPSRPVYKIGGPISAPQCKSCPDPQYSAEARRARHEGQVVLWCVINAEGRAENIRIQKSLGMGLDEQAVKAVQKWRFKPAMRDRRPVAVFMFVEVNFHLYKTP